MVVPRVGEFVFGLGPYGPFQWPLLRDRQVLPPPHPPLVISARSYEVLFPGTGTPVCPGCPGAGIAHSQGIPPNFIHHMQGDCLVVATSPLPCCCHTSSSPPWLCVSAPPTCLDEYGFFKSLVVGLPYSSISWHFWVFFVLRLVVILLMVCRKVKRVYLHLLLD